VNALAVSLEVAPPPLPPTFVAKVARSPECLIWTAGVPPAPGSSGSIADCLATHVDDRIDRRVKTGAKDRGDIGGLRTWAAGRPRVQGRRPRCTDLGGWVNEAEVERGNDDAIAGCSSSTSGAATATRSTSTSPAPSAT
jgi:hypothetical protein